MIKYQVTKKQCQDKITGVCPGCGGKVTPLKTVNNLGEPTYWSVCEHCSLFTGGFNPKYQRIVRKLIENNEMIPYTSMSRSEYEDTPERLDYWLDAQTSKLTRDINYIAHLLEESTND